MLFPKAESFQAYQPPEAGSIGYTPVLPTQNGHVLVAWRFSDMEDNVSICMVEGRRPQEEKQRTTNSHTPVCWKDLCRLDRLQDPESLLESRPSWLGHGYFCTPKSAEAGVKDAKLILCNIPTSVTPQKPKRRFAAAPSQPAS